MMGIAGSSFGTAESEKSIAKRLGRLVGSDKSLTATVCFDSESLPVEAGKEAVASGGAVVCFASNREEAAAAREAGFLAVNLGLPKMFREAVFASSVDALVVCGGGSGTLMEAAFAYQMGKPIILVKEVHGILDAFEGTFLDKRRRVRMTAVSIDELAEHGLPEFIKMAAKS